MITIPFRLAPCALALLIAVAALAAPARADQPAPAALCPAPSDGVAHAAGPVVEVNPSAIWQPRGGLVLVKITYPGSAIPSGLTLRACIGWAIAAGGHIPGAADERQAVVHLRPSDQAGVINLGIEVPALPPAAGSWPLRIWSGDRMAEGLGLVPVARLHLFATGADGTVVDDVQTIGITSVSFAVVLTLVSVAAALAILHALVMRRWVRRGLAPAAAAMRRLPGQLVVLRLITGMDGRASLSQLQVLIWTIVVGAGAVYVMALSGSLIDITDGTLALLGIAGASSVLSLVGADTTPAAGRGPSWTDLLERSDGAGGVDMRRVQLLFFTVISAAFVVLKVVTSYVIPDIPTGYLLLMGISNGVYLGGKYVNPAGT